jgi:type 1 glutamine amidotransferase
MTHAAGYEHDVVRRPGSGRPPIVEQVSRRDGDYALVWTRRHGQGRVFYTVLGHRPEVWADERFRRHLLGGILWAMGR